MKKLFFVLVGIFLVIGVALWWSGEKPSAVVANVSEKLPEKANPVELARDEYQEVMDKRVEVIDKSIADAVGGEDARPEGVQAGKWYGPNSDTGKKKTAKKWKTRDTAGWHGPAKIEE